MIKSVGGGVAFVGVLIVLGFRLGVKCLVGWCCGVVGLAGFGWVSGVKFGLGRLR